MGRYINWSDVVDRYPEIATLGDASKISSSYIVYAEAYVDGALRSHYATPFSETNMTVKDLTIDLAYHKAAGRKIDDAAQVWSQFWMNVDLIKRGQIAIVTASGEVIPQSITPAIYSTTQSYHSAFGMDDPENWRIDFDQQEADEDDRL